jgi:hypothetical protein
MHKCLPNLLFGVVGTRFDVGVDILEDIASRGEFHHNAEHGRHLIIERLLKSYDVVVVQRRQYTDFVDGVLSFLGLHGCNFDLTKHCGLPSSWRTPGRLPSCAL